MDRSKAEELLAEFETGGRSRLGKRDATDALKSLIERLDAPSRVVTVQAERKGLTDTQRDASHWNK
jgi:hypothetical protein